MVCGWIVAPPSRALFGGHRRIAHSGGINGFSSVIVRLPEPNVTVIVLANNDSVNASAIGRDVGAIYYGLPYTIPAARTAVKVDPNLFDQYVGKYELRPGFVVIVTREGTSLMVQATGQAKFEILPESDTTFFAARADLVVNFVRGADGRITHFVLTQDGRDQIAKRIE